MAIATIRIRRKERTVEKWKSRTPRGLDGRAGLWWYCVFNYKHSLEVIRRTEWGQSHMWSGALVCVCVWLIRNWKFDSSSLIRFEWGMEAVSIDRLHRNGSRSGSIWKSGVEHSRCIFVSSPEIGWPSSDSVWSRWTNPKKAFESTSRAIFFLSKIITLKNLKTIEIVK